MPSAKEIGRSFLLPFGLFRPGGRALYNRPMHAYRLVKKQPHDKHLRAINSKASEGIWVDNTWSNSAQVKSTHMPPFKSPRHPPICPPGGSPVRRLGRPPPRLPRSTRHRRRSHRNLLPAFFEPRTCARMLILLSSHAHLGPPPSFTSRSRCHASPAALNNANYVH